jgi:hypothetical protein
VSTVPVTTAGRSSRRNVPAWLIPTASAIVVFALLTVVMTYPLSVAPGTRALDLGGDTRLFLWTIAWDLHALREQPTRVFDANIFFPQHNTLAYSENLLGVALLAAPIYALTDRLLLAMNSATLMLVALGGLGAYVLGRRLGQSFWAALLCGVVFAFAPPRLMRVGQLHMLALSWVPFCLAALHRYLETRRRGALHAAVWLFCAQTLSSGHGAVALGLAVLGLAAHSHLCDQSIRLRPLIRDLGWRAGLPLLICALVALPYIRARSEMGLVRTLDEARFWSPNIQSFVAPATHLDRAVLRPFPALAHDAERNARTYLFPGWLALVLALVAFRRRPGADRAPTGDAFKPHGLVFLELGLAGALGLAAVAHMSGGVRWQILGLALTVRSAARPLVVAGLLLALRLAYKPRTRSLLLAWVSQRCAVFQTWLERRVGRPASFYVWLGLLTFWAALGPAFGLYTLLHHLLPGFDLIRVPSRLYTLVVLSLAVLAGTGLDRLLRRFGPGWTRALGTLAVLLVATEYVAAPLPAVPYSIEVPAIDRWLATQPRPFSLVELPVADPRDEVQAARWHTQAMLHSTAHWQGIVNGYSGFTPPEHDRLFRLLASFPNEAALKQIEAWGVCYALFHPRHYPEGTWKRTEIELKRFSDRLALVKALEDGQVYRLTRSACGGLGGTTGKP